MQTEPNILFSTKHWIAAALLLLVVAGPLFVCAPVTSDTSLFDVQALTAMRGGILYRDIVEPNLPGVVWIHIAIRSIVGWSSEAIRIVDLLIVAATLLIFGDIIRSSTQRTCSAFAFCFVCLLFYVTRNEWCHCQRDIWMLLPVSCAMWLRVNMASPENPGRVRMVEGVFWGIAFWIKPHVAIPALAVLGVDAWMQRKNGGWLKSLGHLLCGGITAAIPGIVWLIVTGAWEPFWEMMLEWNPEYLATGRSRRSLHRVTLMLSRFWPWWWLHLLAVPLSVRNLWTSIRNADGDRTSPILSAIYLAWLAQTFLLQHAMDYIHVPEIILAIMILCTYPWQIDMAIRRTATAGFLALVVLTSTTFQIDHLSAWPQCFAEGSSPEIRSALAQGNFPDWKHLSRVKDFLEAKDAADYEVANLNVHSIHLHQQLQILPATRYWSVNCLLTMYPSRFDQISAAVSQARQKYVVTEQRESDIDGQIQLAHFPKNHPLVFESGSYRVYEIREPRMTRRSPRGQMTK